MSDAPTPPSFFVSGGTVPLASSSYVARQADRALLDALRSGLYCYVLTSRQMGKSSLSVRTMEALKLEGIRTAFVDLTRIGGRNVSPDQWYAGLLGEVGRGLGGRAAMLAYWKGHPEMGPMQRFFGAIHEVGLADPQPVVVFIDEIDATRSLSFSTDEFFAGIRECYNRRVEDPAMARLTFCLIGVAIPSDLMADPTLTPFNVGERIVLRGFTAEEAAPLAKGLEANGRDLIERVVHWTGGQPFLTQSLCRKLVEGGARGAADVDRIVAAEFFDGRARETNINLADVGNRVLNGYDDPSRIAEYRADVLSLYAKVLKGKRVADDESNRLVAVLKLAGLLDAKDGRLVVRNRIYAHVFDVAWVDENMPIQESERQRRAYRAGMVRVGLGAGAALVVVGALGGYGWKNAVENERQRAKFAKLYEDLKRKNAENNELNYVSNMQAVSEAFEHGTGQQIQHILSNPTGENAQTGWERRYFRGLLYQAAEYPAEGDRAERHRGRIGRVAFDANGDLLTLDGSGLFRPKGGAPPRVVYDGQGTLRHWSGATGRCVASLSLDRIPGGTSLDFSPRGDFAYVATASGTLERRPVNGLARGAMVRKGGGTLSGLEVGPGATHALVWEGARREVVDLKTGQLLGTFGLAAASAEDEYALFPNHDVLVAHREPGSKRASLRRMRANPGAEPRRVWEYPVEEGIGCVAISADGSSIAFSDGENAVRFLDADGRRSGETIKHATSITALAFDAGPKGRPAQLATGSEDGVVKISDLRGSAPIQVFPGRNGGISSIAFSPDGRRLAVGTAYGVAERLALREFDGPAGTLEVGGAAPDAAVAHGNRWIATPGDAIRLYNAQDGKLSRTIRSGPQTRVALSGDGRTLVSCGPDGKNRLHVWDPETGAEARSFEVELPKAMDFRLSVDGKRILAFEPEGTVGLEAKEPILYDVDSGQSTGSLLSAGSVHDARFSADGKQVALVSSAGKALLYRENRKKPLSLESGRKDDQALSVAFSPDGTSLAVGWKSGFVQLYDAKAANPRGAWWGRSGPVSSLDFSPDGLTLFTASSDPSMRMWRMPNGSPVGARTMPEAIERIEATEGDAVYAFSRRALRVLRVLDIPGKERGAPEPSPLGSPDFASAYQQIFMEERPMLALVGFSTQPSTMAIRSLFEDPQVGGILKKRFLTTVVLTDRIDPNERQSLGDDLGHLVETASAYATAFAIQLPPSQSDAGMPMLTVAPAPFSATKIDGLLAALARAAPKMTPEEKRRIRNALIWRAKAFSRDASDAGELGRGAGRQG